MSRDGAVTLPDWWLLAARLQLSIATGLRGLFDFVLLRLPPSPAALEEILAQLAKYDLACVRVDDEELADTLALLREDCTRLLAYARSQDVTTITRTWDHAAGGPLLEVTPTQGSLAADADEGEERACRI